MIYLLRHGEIESDGIRRFIGQTDIPLSEDGRARARTWGEAFSGTAFDAIYTSDLSRCVETARIIAGHTGNEIHLLSQLREIRLGKLEGLPMNEARSRFPEEWSARGKDMAGYVPEGGESFCLLQKRVLPAFQDAAARHGGNVLVVSHAGVNRVILCHVLGMPVSNLFRIEQSHGCLNLLEQTGDGFSVSGINLTSPP